MKKCLSIIFILLLMVTFVGCEKDIDNNKENTSLETVITKQAGEQIKENEKIETLSAEDKAVKTEIAKYSDTKVDFRHKMQETVQNRTHDITFEKFNDSDNPTKIIYKNEEGDEFKYDIQTGKLLYVFLNSNITSRTENSIDLETAHKIALEFFPDDCDINEYQIYLCKESTNNDGYNIWYVKYIGKYETTAAFRAKIGYDGSIVYIHDATDMLGDKIINFDEKFVDAKINEFVQKHNVTNIDYDNARILVSEGKLCVSFHYSSGSGEYVTELPLE